MHAHSGPVLSDEDTVDKAARLFKKSPHAVLLVNLHPTGWGAVTRREVEELVNQGHGSTTLSTLIGDEHIPSVHPDNTLDTALRYVDRWPLVPVVNRADLCKLEGVITQRDVLERYRDFGGE